MDPTMELLLSLHVPAPEDGAALISTPNPFGSPIWVSSLIFFSPPLFSLVEDHRQCLKINWIALQPRHAHHLATPVHAGPNQVPPSNSLPPSIST